jgi:hypothetical protein
MTEILHLSKQSPHNLTLNLPMVQPAYSSTAGVAAARRQGSHTGVPAVTASGTSSTTAPTRATASVSDPKA